MLVTITILITISSELWATPWHISRFTNFVHLPNIVQTSVELIHLCPVNYFPTDSHDSTDLSKRFPQYQSITQIWLAPILQRCKMGANQISVMKNTGQVLIYRKDFSSTNRLLKSDWLPFYNDVKWEPIRFQLRKTLVKYWCIEKISPVPIDYSNLIGSPSTLTFIASVEPIRLQ